MLSDKTGGADNSDHDCIQKDTYLKENTFSK